MEPLLSPHAKARMQQRAISAEALERLLDFGREQHLARDKDIVFFDRKAPAAASRCRDASLWATMRGSASAASSSWC